MEVQLKMNAVYVKVTDQVVVELTWLVSALTLIIALK
jgi:hypothetical protein